MAASRGARAGLPCHTRAMSFAAGLKAKVGESQSQLAAGALRSFREACLVAARDALTHACHIHANPHRDAWEMAEGQSGLEKATAAAGDSIVAQIKRALSQDGLTQLKVSIENSYIELRGQWSGKPTDGEPDFVASLNKAVQDKLAWRRDLRLKTLKKHDDVRQGVGARIIEEFKKECTRQAGFGLSRAHFVIGSYNYKVCDHVAWRQAIAQRCNVDGTELVLDGAKKLRQYLLADAANLGLANVRVEIKEDGRSFRDTKIDGSLLLLISYDATGEDDGGDVVVTGARTREERDAELRKRAIDVDAPGTSDAGARVPSSSDAGTGASGSATKPPPAKQPKTEPR